MERLIVIFFVCQSKSLTTSTKSNQTIKSDIWKITINDLELHNEPGDYSDNPGKVIVLDGKTHEKALLYPRDNLFSKNFQIEECSSKGCKKEPLSKEERKKLDRCSFGGHVLSDPDSKVSLSQCDDNGVKDISIVSEKVKLSHDSYRIEKNGTVDVPQVQNFSDVTDYDEEDEEDDWTDVGGDYALNADDEDIPVFFDRNMNAITVIDLGNGCCRAERTQCEVITRSWEVIKKCKVIPSDKKLCQKKCDDLKKFAREKAKKQKKAAREKEKKEKEKKETMEHKNKTESEEAQKKNDIPNDVDSSEEFMDDSGSDEYYDEVKDSKSKEEKSYAKMKNMNKISKSELEKIVKEINSDSEKDDPNPKCEKKPSKFRSTGIIYINTGCANPPCRKKEPIPQKKAYTHRTAEIGVYIDKAMYDQVSAEIDNSDAAVVKKKIVEIVHSIFVDVENFLTHESFTSLPGGFKIAINGIHIYKEDNEYTRQWNSETTLVKVLNSFQNYAFEVNGACDAEQNSYDAMVLFTGRGDELRDVGRGRSMGYAYVGAICKIAPATVLTLRLDGRGLHDQTTSRLLSHELGHLFGSDHDGSRARNSRSYYRDQGSVPCEAYKNLMSPSVGISMNTWSECTKNMIDKEDDERKKEGKDCFFT